MVTNKYEEELTVTIDTLKDKESKVCLKLSRNGKAGAMISEPFYINVCSSNCPSIPDGCQALQNKTDINWKT